jgi:hypothetical protein
MLLICEGQPSSCQPEPMMQEAAMPCVCINVDRRQKRQELEMPRLSKHKVMEEG